MRLKTLIDQADPERVEAFMVLAKESLEPRDLQILTLIVEFGMTPWRAADRTASLTGNSVHTLYLRAKAFEEEIATHFGTSTQVWAERLHREGKIQGILPHQVPEVIRRFEALGIEVEQDITLKLADRE